jgi:hypothetical protein
LGDLPVGQFLHIASVLTSLQADGARIRDPLAGNDDQNLRARYFAALFFGTFCPAALASERPIAIACLRLLTFRPERPLFRVPALRFFIARSTLADAFFEYFRAMTLLPFARK